jgi:cyclophilin family peptidyl-prolyl cis-trans isomerase/protein-disulfide isomerase
MSKKTFLILIIGVLLISSCAVSNSEETETPGSGNPQVTTESPGQDPTEAATEETEVVIDESRMPCTTAFDYPTTPETDAYQAVVDQLDPVSKEDDWIYGDPDAPITIMEYADFQCPACPSFSLGVKSLVDQYPGSIRFVFRHLPLYSIHDKAFISSMAAEAAGAQDRDKFWEMHDILYINQQEWFNYSEEEFVSWALFQAEAIGLDAEQFETDLFDEDLRQELEDKTNELLSMGVNYTPFKIVNERIYRDNKPDIFGLLGIYEFGGFEECPPWVIDPEKSYTAILDTSAGEIQIQLYADVAPLAVNSFVFLAQEGWFDEVYFHRVIEGFVAQAGDPTGQGYIGPGYTFINEIDPDLSFDKAGILGMANAGMDTNGSQFFITLGPTTQLDGGYTIFGEVSSETLSVIDEIALRDPETAVGFDDATIIYGIEIIEE